MNLMSIRPSEIFVIMPAFNESRVIYDVIDELVDAGYQVVVVDDGSQDNTYAVALRFPVYVLRHPCNLGQGAAIQTGITFSLQNPACKYIVTYDSDGQHRVVNIHNMISELQRTKSDVVLGSRFLDGVQTINIPWRRLVILKLATIATRLTIGLKVTDTHNGLRVFTRTAASQIQITQNRMSHATEILEQVRRLKMNYVEVQVHIHYTDYSLKKGQSILNSINILWDSLVGRLK